MKYKKSMFMILLVIFLFSIAAVSAIDVNDSSLASEDTDQMGLSTDNEIIEDNLKTNEEDTQLSQSDNDETVSAENELDVLGEYECTYTELKDEIGNGGNINLTKSYYRYNYTVDSGKLSIEITTSGVIDGKGAVIDMAGSGIRAFTVSASGVTIKNLTIKNVYVTDYEGGAIYFNGEGTVSDCNFINNRVNGDRIHGGAIYFAGDASGKIINCNFVGNKAIGVDGHGGAVFSSSSRNFIEIKNCNFSKNTADGVGGAIFINGKGNVTDCNFVGNEATGVSAHGSAVAIKSGSVINCNLTNNSDAIWVESGSVEKCNFVNSSSSNDGAAIYFFGIGTVSDCNFTNSHASKDGGAIYLYNGGTVTNCNFVNNSASDGGAVFFSSSDNVIEIKNCNFTANTASNGGAVYFLFSGTVTNCNFVSNTASKDGGAIRVRNEGNVTNCNFVNNSASEEGGAIYCMVDIALANCNFTGNNATTGSAICFYDTSYPKNIFNSRFLNNRANAKELKVAKNENNITIIFTGQDNLLNAIYSPQGVNFTNVTYWGVNEIKNTGSSTITLSGSDREAGQNITIVGVVNGNIINTTYITDAEGMIILENVGDYYIVVRHNADSYYTQAETIAKNMELYANVTSQTTYNKTVNITANSNIPTDVIGGKLVFIFPNSDEINATYAGNGVWWVEYTFDDYGDYDINASYDGLDNVNINNATISIRNIVPIHVNDTMISFKEVADVVVALPESINGQNITITVGKTSENVAVVNGEAKASFADLPAGEYVIAVSYSGDGYNSGNSTTAKLIVNKLKTELTGNAVTAIYNINKVLTITLKDSKGNPLSGVKVTVYLNSAKEYTTDKNGQIKVSTKGLAPKAYTAKVTFDGNGDYVKSTKDVKVTVKKATPKMTAKKKTFKKSTKTKKYAIVLKDNTGKAIKKAKVTLKVKGKTYKAKTNSKGKATFKITKLKKKGTFKAVIKFAGNKYYNKLTKKVKVKVR